MSTEPSQALSAQISPEPKATTPYPPDCPPNPLQSVTNQQFIENVFHTMPSGAHVAVCSKLGNPKQGPWWAKQAETSFENLMDDKNNYFSCSSFYKTESGLFSAKKENVVALHAILFDDVEGKVSRDKFINIQLSYEIETSPGNFQAGIILKEPITDMKSAERLTKALTSKGFSDPDAGGVTRWARLPRAINGKVEYIRDGKHFQCRLTEWRPECRYSLEEIVDKLGLDLDEKPEPTIPEAKQKTPSNLPYFHKIQEHVDLHVLQELVNNIDPDCGHDVWFSAGAAIHTETQGSRQGFDIFNIWSAKGKKYPGKEQLHYQWKQYRLDIEKPKTIATLIHFAKQHGANVDAIVSKEQFSVVETVVVSGEQDHTLDENPLRKFSLKGQSGELEQSIENEHFIIDRLALSGQMTLFYAAPNTGKTLILLKEIASSIKRRIVDPNDVYFLNMDDTANGLLEKVKIAEQYGFHMLSEGYNDFKSSKFVNIITRMHNANGVVIILDTLKKFVSLMDKNQSSEFTKILRGFVLRGGTVIALAHTNKNKGDNKKSIYGGTSDFVDDSDCVYIIDILKNDPDSGEKVVEFENIKRRGNVAMKVAFSYVIGDNINYSDLIDSVQTYDENRLEELKRNEGLRTDIELIDVVKTCITDGFTSKMALAVETAKRAGISRKAAINIIDKYTGTNPAAHRWNYTVAERGRQVFNILQN